MESAAKPLNKEEKSLAELTEEASVLKPILASAHSMWANKEISSADLVGVFIIAVSIAVKLFTVQFLAETFLTTHIYHYSQLTTCKVCVLRRPRSWLVGKLPNLLTLEEPLILSMRLSKIAPAFISGNVRPRR